VFTSGMLNIREVIPVARSPRIGEV